eukprot:2120282-Amphidinium_carterae.1
MDSQSRSGGSEDSVVCWHEDRRLQQKHQRLEEDELDDSCRLPGNVLGQNQCDGLEPTPNQ